MVTGFDLGDTFNNLIGSNPGAGSSGNDLRAAMVFTSKLRQRLLGGAAEASDILTAINGEPAGSDFWRDFLTNSMPEITMALNPKSVRFVQGKRFVQKDTRNGSVFFHFTNTKGQNNDILRMQFRGNTGNIDLSGSVNTPERNPAALQSGTAIDAQNRIDQDTGALRKLMVWLNLYLLTREPMLLDDNTENEFTITYVSQALPQPINFIGFFSNVLEWEDSADKPNSKDYSFEFVVTRTDPDLDEIIQHVLSFVQTQNNLTPSDTSTLIGVNAPLTTT